ncbi:hypothetical protein SAMN05444374_1186 [Rhodococcoides kroppenstedtii]|uniref:Uncharacterized protein n=1 Tax=Rhodococcoides kroppenstedtii TaxID=293050 RepID=A0A1I0UBT8_9NOCA|nr:hypothetical protein [Rhodococcus kroppenstedtii]SFA61494.1 hypothetical protein SAMN05444374_1186 [Rhodococcus kroppenstedtii]
MTAEEFAERAREDARRSAVEQGLPETVTDAGAIRLLRALVNGGVHANT